MRFICSMPRLVQPVSAWRDQVRRIEDLGFSTVAVSDHIGGGWSMDPVVAMTMAAECTSRLRVASIVLCADFRHPVPLHRAIANLDVFSDGRVDLGLGAGWMRADYDAAGIPFERPAVRIERLAEYLEVVVGLFGPTPFTFGGKHYQVRDLLGLPRPVQQPHPPLLVGGGGQRMLELAGRMADIVGVNPRLTGVADPDQVMAEMSPDGLRQKVDWAREGARAAGRDPDQLRFQLSMLDIHVQHGGTEHRATSSLVAAAPPEALAASPAVLRGDVERCVDALLELRERYGITDVHLGSDPDAVAPIVQRLAGA
jgi:probable F420-dependent oxidoreductase